MSLIKENLSKIRSSIPENVTLVAVSKTKPEEMIMEAYKSGQLDFGENYVQELTVKQKNLPQQIRWHFIGHLQSNKVKQIAPFVYLIHGVDSLKLLLEINKQALKCNRIINCLLQIHIATEETKFGFSFSECDELINSQSFSQCGGIKVLGLMAMASNTSDEKQITTEFKSLKDYFDKLQSLSKVINAASFKPEILSCGMSGDYLLAIREGSTMVRLGSSIFGQRNYNQ